METRVAVGDLYDVIRFDRRLEHDAFRRLADLDVEGCRIAFGTLVDRLELPRDAPRARESCLLLLDLLLRVNRRINRTTSDAEAFHARRLDLIRRFAAIEHPAEARDEFLPALNRLLVPLAWTGREAHHLVVDRAKTYIEEHYHRRISLSTVAEHLNVSPNYLSRQFRRGTGFTLTTYVQRVRLRHARVLLAEGGRSISEIAYLVGYQNYRDFYRNFVKYEHASPRKVQRRLASQG